MVLDVHPEASRLREECEMLAGQYAELVAEIDMLRDNIIPGLMARYMLAIGTLELELLHLRCENQRRRRLLETVQSAHAREERPCLELIERQLDQELDEWHERTRRLQREIQEARERQRSLGRPLEPGEARELKRIYRHMVRKLHPDLHPDLGDKGRVLWLRLQEAYTHGDLDEIRTLALLAEDLPGDSGDSWTARGLEDIREQRERLGNRVMQLLDETVRLKTAFPYDHRALLDDQAWVNKKAAEVREQIQQQRTRRETLGDLLTSLLGDAWKGSEP